MIGLTLNLNISFHIAIVRGLLLNLPVMDYFNIRRISIIGKF